MIKVNQLIRSFRHALRGVWVVFAHEQSFRLQAVIAVLVLVLAFGLGVSWLELVILLFFIAFVLILELINSIFERIADVMKPRLHPVVRDIKDMMAATVLIGSFMAAVVGLVILGPRVLALLGPYVILR